MFAAIFLSIVVGTWNGNWFPSGRAEHRAHPDVEAATIAAAGEMLSEGLRKIDPSGTNDVILVLNEMRGVQVVSNLLEKIDRKGLKLAAISAYRRRDRFDQQQDAILTTLPTTSSGWSRWMVCGKETPPRGYAWADIVLEAAVTSRVYAVHLKSNYGATSEDIISLNFIKRARSIEQLIAEGKSYKTVIIAGDFNADPWKKEFAAEKTFRLLNDAGYLDLLSLLPPSRRATHPHRRLGDTALDHICVKGLKGEGNGLVFPNDDLSDHFAFFAKIGCPVD